MTLQKSDLIAELKISKDLEGIKKEQVKSKEEVKQKVAEIGQTFRPENFLTKVPEFDASGALVPPWKRLMMAKKIADKAKKDAEVQAIRDAETRRFQSIPEWKRNILIRREQQSSPLMLVSHPSQLIRH